ncbi:MAG: hypothetical protein WC924_01575 [Candidatus Gracilibacteria bacterium]
MKKLLPTRRSRALPVCLLISSILLLGCSLLGKYSEIEYNNLVVEKVNETSLAVEATTGLYNETLPDVVTEEDIIGTDEMQSSYETAVKSLEDTTDLLVLEARNLEQQNAVRTELETYRSAAEIYLESYATMLSYYSEGTYKENIGQVETLDEAMHANYTTFIEANNDLVDTLESFVASTEGAHIDFLCTFPIMPGLFLT